MKIALELGDKIVISPEIWPNTKLDANPGDLTTLAPMGTGVYGYQQRDGNNPFTNAPPHEETGGVIYFGNKAKRPDIDSLLRLLNIRAEANQYAIFLHSSDNPQKDGYIHQARLVPKYAMKFMFNALTDEEYEKFPAQSVSLGDAVWQFIESSKNTFGTFFMESPKLQGMFGGDGHFACEELAFGFMLENEYYGVVRIWSRAWLVTK